MSFDSPIRNTRITSMKPITPARSMTAYGTGLRRTFSTIAQKMPAVERQEREQVHDRE